MSKERGRLIEKGLEIYQRVGGSLLTTRPHVLSPQEHENVDVRQHECGSSMSSNAITVRGITHVNNKGERSIDVPNDNIGTLINRIRHRQVTVSCPTLNISGCLHSCTIFEPRCFLSKSTTLGNSSGSKLSDCTEDDKRELAKFCHPCRL